MFNFKLKALAPTVKPMDREELTEFIEQNETFIFYTDENELFHVLYHNSGEYLIISSDTMFVEDSRWNVADRISDCTSYLVADINIFAKNLTLTIE